MKKDCSSVSTLLERYFDREVTEAERSLMEDHLHDCPACRSVLLSMGSLRNYIRTPVEEAAETENLPWVWQKIERKIQLKERRAWWESLQDWFDITSLLRKRVLIPAAAVMVILILITTPLFFRKTSSYPGPSVVEYVESQTYNVMIYESEDSKVTVIWLFEGPDQETSTS